MFCGSLALGFLAKGPEAWLPLAGAWIAGRRRPAQMALELAAAIAVVALWAAPALIQTQGEFYRVGIGRHVIHRSFGVMEGHGLGRMAGLCGGAAVFFRDVFREFFPMVNLGSRSVAARRRGQAGKVFVDSGGRGVRGVHVDENKAAALHIAGVSVPRVVGWRGGMSGDDQSVGRIGWGVAASGAVVVAALFAFQWFHDHLLAAKLWRDVAPGIHADTRVAAVDFNEPSIVWEFRRVSTNRVGIHDGGAGGGVFAGRRAALSDSADEGLGGGRFYRPANAVVAREKRGSTRRRSTAGT